jgi:hypothetical protein
MSTNIIVSIYNENYYSFEMETICFKQFPTQYVSKERFKEFLQYLENGSKFLKQHLFSETNNAQKNLPFLRTTGFLFCGNRILFLFLFEYNKSGHCNNYNGNNDNYCCVS